MADVTHALEAKSDQLNAVDLAGPRIIKIRDVVVKTGEQPISVFFDGDNNKPWKPCKGMLRILAGAWGKASENWVGKHVEIYLDPSVTWAGEAVGGVRIKSMSDIDRNGFSAPLALSKQKRIPYKVAFLEVKVVQYPDDKFNNAFDTMVKQMTDGRKTLKEIVNQCEQTGKLSEDQLKRLEDSAPKEGDEPASENSEDWPGPDDADDGHD